MVSYSPPVGAAKTRLQDPQSARRSNPSLEPTTKQPEPKENPQLPSDEDWFASFPCTD